MKPLKQFQEYLKIGIVKRYSPDKPRATFLSNESEKTHRYIEKITRKIGIDEDGADSVVKLCFDIVISLIRAKMLIDGYSASGNEAHMAEVSYLRLLGFNEKNVQFADQLRRFRNGIMYYGESTDKEYAEKAWAFTKKMHLDLKQKL